MLATAQTINKTWSNWLEGNQSKDWHSNAKGAHKFSKTRCTDNYAPGDVGIRVYLYHVVGGPLPDDRFASAAFACNGLTQTISGTWAGTGNFHFTFDHYSASGIRTSGAGVVVAPN